MKRYAWISLILYCLLCPMAWATPTLLADNQTAPVLPSISVLEDPTAQMSLGEVVAQQEYFQAVAEQRQQLGYSRSAWWLRFDAVQTGSQVWWLLLDARNDLGVDVYVMRVDGTASATPLVRQQGFLIPTYAPPLAQGQTLRFFVRLTNHYAPVNVQTQFVPVSAVLSVMQFRLIFVLVALGGTLTLSLYNLFLYFSLRDDGYLQLFVFIVALAVELMALNGVLYLLVASPRLLSLLLPLPGFLAAVSVLGFFRQLIQTPQSVPVADKLIVFIIWVMLTIIVFSPFLPITAAWIAHFGLFILPMAIITTSLAWRRGYRIAHSFIYALLVLALGAVPIILMAIEVLPYEHYGMYMVHGGFLGFVLLLSLIQVGHTRVLREAHERAQAASMAKTEFLTTMSHELRTPMNAVVGLSALLRMTPLNTEQQDYLGKLDTSSRHMLRLIDETLDFSRIEQRGLELADEPFQLRTLLVEISQILQDQAQRKGIRFECQVTLTAAADVRGDATRLSQILLNLAGNAIKFTEQGQVILSITEQVSPATNVLGVLFTVNDTGVGISATQLQRLFQPFVQGEGNKAGSGGFGLGLVISQRLVQAMGGVLQVESRVGEGSCFYFTLHFIKATPALSDLETVAGEAPVLPNISSKHILLVDDDELNRFVARRLLETRGYVVTLAADGAAALEAVCHQQAQPFDLVLMDVSMPVMDGYTASRQLRARGYAVPIVALTAHAVSGERERCEAAGMNDFLTKPFEFHGLEQMVAKWVSNRQEKELIA